MKFKEMPLAHKYCIGKGIEIGGSAHNPFNLKDCINVAPREDEDFHSKTQISICGETLKIDHYAYAHALPFEDDSYDYIISSHVVEHVPDLIQAFIEWNRVVKNGGIVFIVFPNRNALASDRGRSLSCLFEFIAEHKKEKHLVYINEHVWVFSLKTMIDLILFCNSEYGLNWEIIDTEETDSKVGNGHTVVCKVAK